MATLYWELPIDQYFEVAALLAEAEEADLMGQLDRRDELSERIQRLPGYPTNRTKEDLVVISPKNARVWVDQGA